MNYFDFGGTKSPLHFLHANGYPPECYQPLLDHLKSEYHVFGMTLRPLWTDSKPEEIQSWHPLSDDLLRFLNSISVDSASRIRADKVIGVGHSIGAIVTLRAALREPKQFKALVLIDPVLFVPTRLILWKIFKSVGLGERVHPLIKGAKKRRRNFDDLESVFNRYRRRGVFRYFSDENLKIYIEGITCKTDNGYDLVFSPEWEAQIYRTGLQDFDLWRDLPKLNTPTLFIRGAETDTFLEGAARLVKQKQPNVRVETVPRSTHLLPLEHPIEVFDIIQSFTKDLTGF